MYDVGYKVHKCVLLTSPIDYSRERQMRLSAVRNNLRLQRPCYVNVKDRPSIPSFVIFLRTFQLKIIGKWEKGYWKTVAVASSHLTMRLYLWRRNAVHFSSYDCATDMETTFLTVSICSMRALTKLCLCSVNAATARSSKDRSERLRFLNHSVLRRKESL